MHRGSSSTTVPTLFVDDVGVKVGHQLARLAVYLQAKHAKRRQSKRKCGHNGQTMHGRFCQRVPCGVSISVHPTAQRKVTP